MVFNVSPFLAIHYLSPLTIVINIIFTLYLNRRLDLKQFTLCNCALYFNCTVIIFIQGGLTALEGTLLDEGLLASHNPSVLIFIFNVFLMILAAILLALQYLKKDSR